MFNTIMKRFLAISTTIDIPGREFTLPPWLAVVVLIFITVLIIISINYSLRHRVNRIALRQLKEDNNQLNKRITELENASDDSKLKKDQLLEMNNELMSCNDKLKQLAYHDNLTQLPNRLALTELLDGIMLTLRKGETVGLLFLNIDNFKQINTQLGHSYGDELLIDVTHRLQQVIDENDYLARIGSDEFAILTQNIDDSSEYDDQIKRIYNVFSYPFVLSTEERFISVSMGIAIAPKDGKTTSVILKNANVAMNNAKERGNNVYLYFEEDMNEKIANKIQMQSELRKGFEENEFTLYYEPIVELTNNKIRGFEALLCWNHPTRGILYPEDFMAYAEETGIIAPIGIWALKAAFSQLKLWEDSGYSDLKLSYNISMVEFKDPEFTSTIWDIISKSGINPKNLTLEITEATALDNIDYTIKTINKLSELGIDFCLDKFGTNYSSIRYLKKLSVKYIKIDKILFKSALESIDEQKIVEAIINLIKTFKFGVIAEGVDNKEEELFLRDTNCDMAQGTLFSRSVPESNVFELIEAGYIRSKSEGEVGQES